MHQVTDIFIDTLQLLQYAGENNHPFSGVIKLAIFLPLASNPAVQATHIRRIDEFEKIGEDLDLVVSEDDIALAEEIGEDLDLTASEDDVVLAEEIGEDLDVAFTEDDDDFNFMDYFETPSMEKIIEQCGVNVDGIITDAMMQAAILMNDISEDNLPTETAMETAFDRTHMEALVSNFGDFDGQRICLDEEMNSLVDAFAELSCTGISALIGKVAFTNFDVGSVVDYIFIKCGALMSWSPFDSDSQRKEKAFQAQPTSGDLLHCLDATFEPNNPIGDFLRDIYEHTSNYCQCMREFGKKVPDCTFEKSGDKVSLSIIRRGTCALNVGCDALQDFCLKETAALEGCLPEIDGSYDCTRTMKKCAQSGSTLTVVPAMISTTLPDICQDVTGDATVRKFESFQKKCRGKKDFLALFEDWSRIKVKPKVPDSSSTTKKHEKKKSSANSPIVGLAIFICVVVVSFVIIKRKLINKKIKHRKDFVPVSSDGLEYEEEEEEEEEDAEHCISFKNEE